MAEESKDIVLSTEEIKSIRNHENMVWCNKNEDVKFNTMLYASTFSLTTKDTNKIIGRVVQIREKQGVFGSNSVLIRHPDGSLADHQNDSYYVVPKEIEERVKSYFEYIDPEGEEYTVAEGVPHTGFFIAKEKF